MATQAKLMSVRSTFATRPSPRRLCRLRVCAVAPSLETIQGARQAIKDMIAKTHSNVREKWGLAGVVCAACTAQSTQL